jgi:hypothetical protein
MASWIVFVWTKSGSLLPHELRDMLDSVVCLI